MNIETLKIFILVFQKGSFAAAAKQLNKSPSSVSRAISGLETELKTRLFHRNTRSLIPSHAGTMYYDRVLPLVEEFESLHHWVSSEEQDPSGMLRLSASTAYGQLVLPSILSEFSKIYPNITFDLDLSDTRKDLIENQIDLAIRHGNLPDSSLVARKVHNVSYFLVASPDYLANKPKINIPQDLLQHQIITFNLSTFAKQWQFVQGAKVSNIEISPFMKISNALAIRECVLRGMGVSLLADWTIKQDISQGDLVRVLPHWQVSGANRESAIWAVHPTRSFIPKKVQVFSHFLISRYQSS